MCWFPDDSHEGPWWQGGWSQCIGTAKRTSRLRASIVEKSWRKGALNRSDLMGRDLDGSTRDVWKSLDLLGPQLWRIEKSWPGRLQFGEPWMDCREDQNFSSADYSNSGEPIKWLSSLSDFRSAPRCWESVEVRYFCSSSALGLFEPSTIIVAPDRAGWQGLVW